jgi:hypothetical protein
LEQRGTRLNEVLGVEGRQKGGRVIVFLIDIKIERALPRGTLYLVIGIRLIGASKCDIS